MDEGWILSDQYVAIELMWWDTGTSVSIFVLDIWYDISLFLTSQNMKAFIKVFYCEVE